MSNTRDTLVIWTKLVLCLCGKKTVSHREESQPRPVPNRASVNAAGSYSWDIWSTLLDLLYLQLNTWPLHSYTDVSKVSLGGPFTILEIFTRRSHKPMSSSPSDLVTHDPAVFIQCWKTSKDFS